MDEREIKEILAEALGMPAADIPDDAKQGEFEKWDSVRHLNFVVALEKKFDIEFEPEEIAEIRTLGEVAAVVETRRR
ncbi:MAG: acyl carrier protein [Proteobacteria bacterium]|jgi:acyl carrier protein|nr:acyl carrier protein [Pseudomonadota bacterium]MDE0911393.1 acyl carrier protein [Myxococcota bacterium]